MVSHDIWRISKAFKKSPSHVKALGNESALSFRTCRARAGSEWWCRWIGVMRLENPKELMWPCDGTPAKFSITPGKLCWRIRTPKRMSWHVQEVSCYVVVFTEYLHIQKCIDGCYSLEAPFIWIILDEHQRPKASRGRDSLKPLGLFWLRLTMIVLVNVREEHDRTMWQIVTNESMRTFWAKKMP